MRDPTKIRAFELADEVTMPNIRDTYKEDDISSKHSKIVETEKVLGALIRSLPRPERTPAQKPAT